MHDQLRRLSHSGSHGLHAKICRHGSFRVLQNPANSHDFRIWNGTYRRGEVDYRTYSGEDSSATDQI